MAQEAFSELTFLDLELHDEIRRAVKELGFEKMTPIQAQAIPALMEGGDIIGQAQTGTGKTAAFGIPILEKIDPEKRSLQALILCPTRELAMQAADDIRGFAKYMQGVKVLPVYGGQDIMRQIKNLKGVQIIVGTPGRVMDHMRRHTIKLDDVSMVVLDEADEMLDMGFREDMELILGEIDHEHQTCLFSATMPEEILALTVKFQQNPRLIRIASKALTIERIAQYYYPVKHEYKTLALTRLLTFYRYQRCIIFCNTKTMVADLTAELQKEGYAADGLHGDLSQAQRDYVMGRFRGGSLSILLATDIAARGIDVDDVEAVFNYDLPQETEYYVHRIGRTGRAGKEGVSHSLCAKKDLRKLHEIERVCNAVMEERRIPGAAEIKASRTEAALMEVFSVLESENVQDLIPLIREFCEEHDLLPEEFAAAAIKKELGQDLEDIAISLPKRREDRDDWDGRKGRRDRDRRRHEDDDERRRDRRHEDDDERRRGRRHEKDDERTYNRYHDDDDERRRDRHHENDEKHDRRKLKEKTSYDAESGKDRDLKSGGDRKKKEDFSGKRKEKESKKDRKREDRRDEKKRGVNDRDSRKRTEKKGKVMDLNRYGEPVFKKKHH